MLKRTSVADQTRISVVIVTMDSHLSSATMRANQRLVRDLPGLSLEIHAAATPSRTVTSSSSPCCSWKTTGGPWQPRWKRAVIIATP
jgi:hypothetical protein